ncbi:MAG: DUF3786 domain-containing protein [Candidatus Omnitrophica bacterium]|nr:DUF3786 domain-containing protein [Candidatus Omnitrophota bacterium]
MGYETAIQKAWENLGSLCIEKHVSVKFLADEYSVDTQARTITSLSCNIPAKDYAVILILHYLVRKFHGLPELTGEWISFKELECGESYYPAFRKRAIEPVIRKYGVNPEGLLAVLDRVPAKKVLQGDVGIVLEVFPGVPAQIILWKGDEEFGPEANMLFDRSISGIFCTEDIAVLGGFIGHHV